jgi:hypothetical protein
VTTPSDPSQHDRPPRELVISFWCYLAAATIALIDGLLYLGAKQAILNTLRANTKGLTESQLQTAASTFVFLFVAIPVVIAGLYVLFAYKLRADRRWARTALTIVLVVQLLVVVFVLGGTPVIYLGVLAAIVGCVLSYLPKSKAYLASQRQLR